MNKPCPNCNVQGLVDLPSMNKKICFSCHIEFNWNLKPNQKSVLIKGQVGGQINGASYSNQENKNG